MSGDGISDPFQAARLILELRQTGVTDSYILNIVERTPREKFLSPEFADHAWADVALPIQCGQTISRPVTSAAMVNALELGHDKSLNILEIGTGSGYMTALLAQMARRVFSIDRYRTLVDGARTRLESLGYTNVMTRHADGLFGWPEAAPFDRMISSCASEEPPEDWIEQLKIGGILVMPLGTNEDQFVHKISKLDDGELKKEILAPSRFLHLVEGVSREL